MATITNNITLDVAEQNLIPPVQAKQFDSESRFLKVQLTDKGENITVALGSTVYFNVLRADGQKHTYSGTVNNDGTVTVPLTRWALSLDDIVYGSVSIINGDVRLTTLSFQINVQLAESDDTPSPDEPDIWAQVLLDVDYLNDHALLDTALVTTVDSSSTDSQIPTALAVYNAIQSGGGGGATESAFSIIASESGTSASTNEITITFDKGYKEIQLALNIPPPVNANLSYCGISIHAVGNSTFTANNTVTIQTTHTKAALTVANFKAEKNIVKFAINTTANLGRTYANIQAEASVNQQNGVTGFCGANWNFANDGDYYIDRIVLRPTNNSSAFEAGTNYIVWGR